MDNAVVVRASAAMPMLTAGGERVAEECAAVKADAVPARRAMLTATVALVLVHAVLACVWLATATPVARTACVRAAAVARGTVAVPRRFEIRRRCLGKGLCVVILDMR